MTKFLAFTVPAGQTNPITPLTTFSITSPGAGAVVVTGSTIDADQDDTFDPGGIAGDFDVFGLSVGPGLQIDSIDLDAFGGAGLAFIGLVEGTTLGINTTLGTENGGFPAIASGLALIGSGEVGTDILDDLNFGAAGQAPQVDLAGGVIGEGDFVFTVQNTGPAANSFSFSFNASEAIPEPSSFALLGGLALAGCVRRRRR